VAPRSSLVSDLHQTNVEEEAAEADHTEIPIVAEGAEDMETGHHTGHTRAFVQVGIREMTGIGVIKKLRWSSFAFRAFTDLIVSYIADPQWYSSRL